MYIKYNFKLNNFARKMRNNPTEAERIMWNFLRVNYKNLNFFRQKPLGEFIVDFYCPDKKVIIEIDGDIHDKQKERDRERDNYFLTNQNLKTIRFKIMKSLRKEKT